MGTQDVYEHKLQQLRRIRDTTDKILWYRTADSDLAVSTQPICQIKKSELYICDHHSDASNEHVWREKRCYCDDVKY